MKAIIAIWFLCFIVLLICEVKNINLSLLWKNLWKLRVKEYIRINNNFSIYEPKCFKVGRRILTIRRKHFVDDNNTYDIKNFEVAKIDVERKKYRILLYTGLPNNDYVVIQMNWFRYMWFSWKQKSCWVQQEGNIKWILGIILGAMGGIAFERMLGQ